MLSHMILLSPWDKIPCWPLLHRPKLTPALCETLIDKHRTPALLTPYHEIRHSIEGERYKGQQGIWHYFECITKSLWRNLLPESAFNSFTTEVPIIQKPVHDFLWKSTDWFLYDRDLRHERVKASISTQRAEQISVSHSKYHFHITQWETIY